MKLSFGVLSVGKVNLINLTEFSEFYYLGEFSLGTINVQKIDGSTGTGIFNMAVAKFWVGLYMEFLSLGLHLQSYSFP
jgi:hypothetical protein